MSPRSFAFNSSSTSRFNPMCSFGVPPVLVFRGIFTGSPIVFLMVCLLPPCARFGAFGRASPPSAGAGLLLSAAGFSLVAGSPSPSSLLASSTSKIVPRLPGPRPPPRPPPLPPRRPRLPPFARLGTSDLGPLSSGCVTSLAWVVSLAGPRSLFVSAAVDAVSVVGKSSRAPSSWRMSPSSGPSPWPVACGGMGDSGAGEYGGVSMTYVCLCHLHYFRRRICCDVSCPVSSVEAKTKINR